MSKPSQIPWWRLGLAAFCALLVFFSFSAVAAENETPRTSPIPSAPPRPTPIPLADVVTAADAVSDRLRQARAEISSNQTANDIGRRLGATTEEIGARVDETQRTLTPVTPLDTLRDLERRWQQLSERLELWSRDLTERATVLDREMERFPELRTTWQTTLELARNDGAPPELTLRVEEVIRALETTAREFQTRRATMLSLQTRVAEQAQRVTAASRSLRTAQSAAVNRLWVQDSPPLWSPDLRAATPEALMHEGNASLSAQAIQLRTHLAREWPRLVYLALIFCGFAFVLFKIKQRAAKWTDDDPALAAANRVLQLPIATASVITFLFCRPIFPDAPRLFWLFFASVALVPVVLLLRRLIDRHLHPILNALVVFYIVAQVRSLALALPVLSRIILLLETIGGMIFLAWFIRSTGRARHRSGKARKITRAAARVGLVLFGLVLLANSLGYVSLANYLAAGGLAGAYLAVLLYAAAGIVEGLAYFALEIRPLGSTAIVREHRSLLRRRIGQIVAAAAFVIWIALTLGAFAIRETVFDRINAFLNTSIAIRSFQISPGALLAFGLTIWVTVLISRFVRFVLEEDVYDRFRLAPGSSYALSTILHYIILLAGFFVALAAVGVEMTKFAILAGAFGVGIGFGLQNIFNNFFSGLILLLERPVQVGDVVELGNATGTVRRIGIRASVIMLADKTRLIVPNGQLISEKVSNRTLSSRQKSMTLRVRVAYGSDPAQVIELLRDTAAAHGSVAKAPAADAYMKEWGTDGLCFDLIFTTEDVEHAARVQSDVAVAVNAALVRAGLEIPLPQRTVHFASIEPAAADLLGRGSDRTAGAGDESRDGNGA